MINLPRSIILAAACALLMSHGAQADIIWLGDISTDIFDEANWDLSGSAVTVIDPNVSIADDVLIGPGPFRPRMQFLPGIP